MSSGGALVRLNFASRSLLFAADALALEVLLWDPARGEFVAVPFSVANSGARVQRSVTATPIVVGTTDQILNCNISSGPAACTLPSAASRRGIPVTFKDVGGQWAAHSLTFTCTGGDLIDGQASVVGAGAYGSITFVPANDGTSNGWSIE